jgi:arsenate reductase-like glutaredoxin family protein
MNLQIFGTKKSNETKKAERFFKERGIRYQFIDLAEKGMSRGELEAVSRAIPVTELIDTGGKEFERQQLKYMKFNTAEKLLESPLLFKTPVVRDGKRATVGYAPDVWERWIREQR